MNCPVCGLGLKVEEIQEHEGFTLVRRSCSFCRAIWVLRHQDNTIVSVTQEGMEVENYGFDYECPHCGMKSYVATVYQPQTGWKCIRCGKIVPNENITPRGEFKLIDYRAPRGMGTKSRRKRERSSTYQRAPRTSRPIPAGAVPLVELAGRIKTDPKRLRAWLRKVGWRKAEEAGSSWIFSPEEADEVAKNFGR